MSRRPGHEDCPTCEVCGLTPCPDCDTDNAACLIVHDDITCGVCGGPADGTDHAHTVDEVRSALRRIARHGL